MVLAPTAVIDAEKAPNESGGGTARSQLAKLLSAPPKGEGGRNDWLTRVAGHYAKHFRATKDAYEEHVRSANERMEHPLDEAEMLKTLESIWESEQRKDLQEGAPSPDAENGWLIPGDYRLMTEVKIKQGDQVEWGIEEWADFDLRANGVVEDVDVERVYDVTIYRARKRDTMTARLPARTLADSRKLSAWLADFGVTIAQPPNDPIKQAHGVRLQRYLESQNPKHFAVVHSLGWHGDGFITHDGVIRSDGTHPHEDRKPDPKLRNWAPYRYGFADEEVVRSTLREVLTFHDETVCSVYGAWWAATFLKPQVHEVVSQFPFMALEAPSESGKTTGFFSLMLQLNGNTLGQVDPTRAVLRDSISAHQSGIVWIDDLSDTSYLMDLLRQATGEGTVGKKGEDRHQQEMVQLVAPICISGEALQLQGQKALLDRAVMIDVPSPTSRRSLKDPSRRQWDDILELKKRHPDLTTMSGTVVRMLLESAELVHDIPKLVPGSGGRFGDKIAVVRMGARLLDTLVGGDTHATRVDAWADVQEDMGSENTLTLKLIPAALRGTNWLQRPDAPNGRWPATPTFVDGRGTVWFSPQLLAAWWHEMRHGRIEPRTESEEALNDQARALGLGGEGGRKRWKLGGDPNRKATYWRLTDELSDIVVSRSRGDDPRKGVHVEAHRLDLWATTHPEEV
jgi:hypothetical protein